MDVKDILPLIKEIGHSVIAGIENIKDSMQLDSGQELCSCDAYLGGLRYLVSVVVEGRVKVYFRDNLYKCASQMPEELIDCYRNGKDPAEVAVKDGGKYDVPYECCENNWLELIIRAYDDGGKMIENDSTVIDAPKDCSEKSWIDFLHLQIASYYQDYVEMSQERDCPGVERDPSARPGSDYQSND